MPNDLRVVMANRPGVLLRALRNLADAGVNIEGFCGDLRPGETWGYVHILVEDPDTARMVLEAAGYEIVSEHRVETIEAENTPGGLAEALSAYSERGENIEVAYIGAHGVVVGTDAMRTPISGVKTKDASY